MIHVFTHIPHHDENSRIQLFTWSQYAVNLSSKDEISPSQTAALKLDLYSLDSSDIHTKNYTFEEWRGIRPGDFFYNFESEESKSENERRRLRFFLDVEKFCEEHEKVTSGGDEIHFGIWGLQLWASNIVNAVKSGESFLDFY